MRKKMIDSDLDRVLGEALKRRSSQPSPDCPDPEMLIDLIEKKREVADFDALMAHVLGCRHCFPLFEATRQVWAAREPARYPLARAAYRVQRVVEAGRSRLQALTGAVQEKSRRLAERVWNRPGPALAWARRVISEGAESATVPLEPAMWGDLQVLAQVGWEPDGFVLHLALVRPGQPGEPIPHCEVILWRQGQEVDRAVTSEEGFVDFYGLAADTYGLTFGVAPGWLWEVELADEQDHILRGLA